MLLIVAPSPELKAYCYPKYGGEEVWSLWGALMYFLTNNESAKIFDFPTLDESAFRVESKKFSPEEIANIRGYGFEVSIV